MRSCQLKPRLRPFPRLIPLGHLRSSIQLGLIYVAAYERWRILSEGQQKRDATGTGQSYPTAEMKTVLAPNVAGVRVLKKGGNSLRILHWRHFPRHVRLNNPLHLNKNEVIGSRKQKERILLLFSGSVTVSEHLFSVYLSLVTCLSVFLTETFLSPFLSFLIL